MLAGTELEPIKAAVVSSTLDGIVMIDQDGSVLAMNPAAEAMFGYSREEALGRPVADLIIPEAQREAHRRGLAAYLAGGESKVIGKRIEVEAVRKDGRPIPVEVTVLEIKVDDRRIFSATIRDRSEDAAQEEELELVRRRLELAIAGAQLGVWSYNVATGSGWFSDRARDLLGLDGNILANAIDLRSHVHPEDWERIIAPQFDDFPEEPRGIEYRVVLPDGGVRWIYSLGASEKDERGMPEAVHGIIFDITDRKKAEDELESTRHQLELAVEGAQMGVWSYNPHDGSCWFSDRSVALWGLDRNFIANARELESVIHPDDRARSAVRHYDMFPDEPLAAEYRIVRPDGEVRWIYALGAAIRDEDGAFEAVHGIHLDITDRKKAEEELEGARKHLELAVEGAQLGVWSFNPETGKSWFSDRAKEMLGLEDNVVTDSEEFRQRMHPADRGQLAFDRQNGFPDGPVATEYRIIHPDGEMRWIFSLGAAARDENDVAQAIYGIMDDITDRKQAEEDLESARRQLELAVEGAKLGVWSLDPKTGQSRFSDRARDLIGLDSNVLESPRDYKKYVHPDDWKQLTSPYADGFPESSLGIEYRVVRPDGEVRWIYGLGAAERDEAGEADAIHGIMLDITDRKQADEELELMRRRLELALEGAQLGIWSFNPEKGSCWFSDHSKAMLGLPDNSLASARELKNYVHPDDWEELSAPYYSRYPDEPLPMEFRVPLAGGGTRWIYALGAAIRDEAGELEAIHGIHLDVTARKQADQDFELMRRRLELAMNGAKIGVWSFNPETGAIWYSQRSREIYALDPDEPIENRKLRARVHPDDWAKLSAPYFDGFPEEPVEIEYRVVHPDGETRWVYALGAAARGSDGVAHTVHGIHIDVTDRKRAEEELGRSRDALLQSEKLAALGALLAGVSHELNNPLAAIVGQAEMLAEDSQGTNFETRATRIGAAAERCARIVQTFLTMARQGERQTALVNLNEVIATALELTDYSLRTAGIAVRVNFGSGLPPIEGDRDQLHQVLVNLIVNAQQAMEKGEAFEKVLTIRTSVNQAGRVLVDVTDTGPGVPEEMRHRIFEPFFTTKRQGRGGGTGIGLSFSQGIVTAHGGTLVVEPSRRGAHFRIELPAAAGEPIMVVPRQDMVIAEIVPNRRRVLIVEDEPDVAETLRELIEREGFEVTLAANGTEAFFALDKGDYDLLFSDLRMPLLNGPELYERLLEIRPELVRHMAFVTGDTMGDSMGEFVRNCGRPILEKPFTKAGVRAVLAALVDQA